MDNLTHTLTGLMLSRAGFNRVTPYATLTLLVSANVPDTDAVTLFGPQGTYFAYHRAVTHALIALPVMAAVALAIVWALRWAYRRSRWKPRSLRFLQDGASWLFLYALACLGVGSHLALDFTNPYGIGLLFPWSNSWPSLDITHVIDVWIWAALLFALAGPWLSRLVSSEIGARKTEGRGWAMVALLFIVGYDSARWVLSRRAIAVQDAHIYEGQSPRQVLIFPDPVNPFLWKGAVETDDVWVVQSVNLLRNFDPTAGRAYYKPPSSPAIEAARGTPAFRNLLRFSKGVLWRTTPQPDGGSTVRAMDIRFGNPVGSAFVATARLDPANRVLSSVFRY